MFLHLDSDLKAVSCHSDYLLLDELCGIESLTKTWEISDEMMRVFFCSGSQHTNKETAACLWWRGNIRDGDEENSNQTKFHSLNFFPWTWSLCSSLLSGPGLFRKRALFIWELHQSSVSAGCCHTETLNLDTSKTINQLEPAAQSSKISCFNKTHT